MFSVLSHFVFLGLEYVHHSVAVVSPTNAHGSSKLQNISSVSAKKNITGKVMPVTVVIAEFIFNERQAVF